MCNLYINYNKHVFANFIQSLQNVWQRNMFIIMRIQITRSRKNYLLIIVEKNLVKSLFSHDIISSIP